MRNKFFYLLFAATIFSSGLRGQNPEETSEEQIQEPTNFVFTDPGIIFSKEGRWQGSDLLVNLSDDIGIYTEINSGDKSLNIDTSTFNRLMNNKLTKEGFKTRDPFTGGNPDPFLHLLLYVYPIDDKGYAALCMLRLFESVKLERLPPLLEQATFQAITWEKDTFVIAPKDTLQQLLEKSVAGLVADFIDRYRFFEKISEKKRPPTPSSGPSRPSIPYVKKPTTPYVPFQNQPGQSTTPANKKPGKGPGD